ncbi:LamG-like jellyroll fold domain-containing protein [Salininema proteolyticum]|uniref:LamG-like jellyroll fold domain-containing protein n=1 Tax=Salininema proteolyticum TaxID=1607685 RepID=A0ABV8TXX6_9ACTN
MRPSLRRPLALALAVVTASATAATLVAAPPVAAQTADDTVPPGSGSSETTTDTEIDDALDEAASTGQDVEIESLSSPDSDVFATPDGVFAEEVALEPFQAQQDDGSWAPIDNTLVASGNGAFVPTNNDSGLEVSDGGDTVIAKTTDVHGRSVAYTWHENLPTPEVTGDTAVFPEIVPGVDLKVKATDDGFSKVFEVKTPEAAASPEVANLSMGLELDGYTAAIGETGALEINDFAGNVVAGGPTPIMWDSTPPDEGVGDSTTTEWSPTTFAVSADVALAYTDGQLTLTPDAEMLADPDAVYPIRIDPKQVAVGRSAWAMVSDYYSYRNRNYYNGGSFEKDPNGTARLGRAYDYNVGMEQTWRLAFEFDTARFRGRDILDADLRLTMTYSWMRSCDGISATADIYELDANLRKMTWNNQGSWGSKIASRDEGIASGCGAPRQLWTDVTGYVSDTAGTKDRKIQFGLKSSSESCGTHCPSFRRFGPEKTKDDNGGVYLRVKYNTPPNKPGSFTIDGQSCRPGTTVKLGAAAAWTVTAKLTDDEGDNMDGVLKWTDNDSGSSKTWNTAGADRERATWSVHRDGISGQSYRATVSAKDGRATGSSSGGCTVLVDTTPPEKPTVTSTDYPSDGDPHGSVGKTGRFTLESTSSDTAGYYWSLQDATGDNEVPVSTPGRAATIAFDPPTDGPLTLSTWAYDAHGNVSDKTTYNFSVNPASSPIAHWKLDETEGETAPDWAYPGNADDVDLPLAVSGAEWSGGNAADAAEDHLNYLTFDGRDEATTDGPAVRTDSSYTVSAWVRIHQTDTDYTIVSQDGNVNSAFMLKYDGESHEFLMVASNKDSTETGLSFPSAGSEVNVEAGVWYHVTGVFGYNAQQLSLYVNGQLQNTASFSDSWNSTGSFVVGRDLYGGNESTHFAGDVDDVKVWDRTVFRGEVERLGQHAKGIWDFEGISAGYYDDKSGNGPRLYGDNIEIAEGYTGQAAMMDGSTSTLTTESKVIDTSGDFTIGAWARLDRDGTTANVLSQDGDYISPFYFGYHGGGNAWSFRSTATDGTGYTWNQKVDADTPVRVGEWTHLAVVYRAEGGTVDFYVNGNPAGHGEDIDLWASTGNLRVGSVLHKGGVVDHWPGLIDDVNINTGAFDDQQVKALADISERETRSELVTGDFNGDGYVDALAVVDDSSDYSDVFMLEGNAEGGFTRRSDEVFESDDYNLPEVRDWYLDDAVWRSGDVNGDGRDDLIVAVPEDAGFEVWAIPACSPRDRVCRQNAAVFAQSGIAAASLNAKDGWELSDTQIQVGDVTGDQHDDLVMLRGDGRFDYSVWTAEFVQDRRNAGFGAPTQVASESGDSRTIELAVADFDGDWRGDIAEIRTGSDGNAEVYVRYGSGTGMEAPKLAFDSSGGWFTHRDHVTIADVSGDGLPDIVASYRFDARVRLQVAVAEPNRGGFKNSSGWDHSARCTGCASDLTQWPHVRLAGGDIDNDGKEDLFTLRAGIGGEIGALWTRKSNGDGFADATPTWADPTTCFGADGDVNGDGYRDAVLPNPSQTVDGQADAGAIWFVDGATQKISLIHANSAGINGVSEAGDLFGHAVDTYDSDGDGCAEIVVGIPGENSDTGYTQILPGSRDGIDTASDLMISQNTSGYPGAAESGDKFGWSVAATNTAHGTPILVIGAPGEDVQTDTTGAYRDGDARVSEVTDGGALIYVKGDRKAWVDQNSPGVGGGVETGDQFGWDIDASPTHFIVGVPFEDGGADQINESGGALLFNHYTSKQNRPNFKEWYDQDDAYMPGGLESSDRIGYSVAIEDYWPEGEGPWKYATKIAVSTPWEDLSGFDNAGVVTLLDRNSAGTTTLAEHYSQGSALGEAKEDFDHIGTSVELVNMDDSVVSTNATLKLAVGVPDENFATADDDGLVHVTGAAAPGHGKDTVVTYSDANNNGSFGAGIACLPTGLFATALGDNSVYSLDWADAKEGTTQTAVSAGTA